MRWMVGLLPAIVWAQVELTIPDTLPSHMLRWQDIRGDVLLRVRGAVRILACLEPSHADAICTPFARQPITLIADSLRLPFATLIGELRFRGAVSLSEFSATGSVPDLCSRSRCERLIKGGCAGALPDGMDSRRSAC